MRQVDAPPTEGPAFDALPEGTGFFDVDGKPIAIDPAGKCWNFLPVMSGRKPSSVWFPSHSKALEFKDRLTKKEFEDWIKTGRNKFDVR